MRKQHNQKREISRKGGGTHWKRVSALAFSLVFLAFIVVFVIGDTYADDYSLPSEGETYEYIEAGEPGYGYGYGDDDQAYGTYGGEYDDNGYGDFYDSYSYDTYGDYYYGDYYNVEAAGGYMGIMPFAGRIILFDLNGGESSEGAFVWRATTTPEGSIGAANMPANPTRDGYHFISWTRTFAGLGTGTAASTTEHFTGTSTITEAQSPHTVFAQWGHEVSFHGNGITLAAGTGVTQWGPRLVPAGFSFNEANPLTWTNTLWPNNPSRAGYAFMGWYTRVGGNYDQRFDGDSPITGDVRLYAQWRPLDVGEPLEVIFETGDGTPWLDLERRPVGLTGAVGAANMPANPDHLSGPSYRFLAWTRTQDGANIPTGNLNAMGVTFTGTSTIFGSLSPYTVYAQWGHEVTFYGNGFALNIPASPNANNATHYGPRIVASGRSFAESNPMPWTAAQVWPNNPTTWTNHRFVGWYTVNPQGEYDQRFDANTPITGDVLLYARWEEGRVYFNPRDGVTLPEDFEWRNTPTFSGTWMQVTTANMPATPIHPSDYRFMGWTRTEAGLGTATGSTVSELFTGTCWAPLLESPYTVYAQWGHQVSFNGNGVVWTGTTLTGTGAAQYGPRVIPTGRSFADTIPLTWTSPVFPNDPTRAGYHFAGWYTMVNGNLDQRVGANTIITGDITFYARWVPQGDVPAMTVIFNPRDGVTPSANFEEVPTITSGTGLNSVGAVNWPVNPTHPSGYHFMGWTRTEDGNVIPPWTNNTVATTGIGFTNASTITLEQSPFTVYGQWGHQVSFYGNGMTLNIPASPNPNSTTQYGPRMVSSGRTFLESNPLGWTPAQVWPNDPTWANHRFVGWYTVNPQGEYDQRFDNNTPILADVLLYARWEQQRVYFNPQDGVTLPDDFEVRVTLANGSVGVNDMPADPVHPSDYRFMGWTRTQAGYGAGTGVANAELFTGTSTHTLAMTPFTVHAQWGHQVSFYGNGITLNMPVTPNPNATGNYCPRIVSSGRTFTNSNILTWTPAQQWPANPTWASHRFMGWYTVDHQGNYLQRFDANTPITADVLLYARWEVSRVYFNPQDGVTLPDDFEVRLTLPNTTVGAANMPAIPVHPSEYHFLGWTRSPDGFSVHPLAGATIHFTGGTAVNLAHVPITVYGQWGHEVRFYGNAIDLPAGVTATGYGPRIIPLGLSFVETDQTYNWLSPIWPNDPTRFGHRFVGWYTRDHQGYAQRFDRYTPIPHDVLLFARWEPLSVIFNPQDGVTLPPAFEVRSTNHLGVVGDQMPPNPSHPQGYHFMGWTRTPDGLGPHFSDIWGTGFFSNSLVTPDESTADSPLMVFAQWGHQVSFNGNGVTLNIPTNPNPNVASQYGPRLVRPGMSVVQTNATLQWYNLVWPNNPLRTGHTFMGWYTKNHLGEYDQRFDRDTIITEDVELFAKWARLIVIFDPQDGVTLDPNDFVRRETLETSNWIGTANMPANPTHPQGYHFLGWTRTTDGLGPSSWIQGSLWVVLHFIGTSVVDTTESPLTVYAQWGHRVTFNGNGITLNIPSNANPNNAAHYGPRVTYPGLSVLETHTEYVWINQVWPNDPTRAGFNFMGWYSRNDQGYVQRFDRDTPVTACVELFARWEALRVHFNPQDGVTTPPFIYRETVVSGTIGLANWPPNPVHPNSYTFMGWTRLPDGSGPLTWTAAAGAQFTHNSTLSAAEAASTFYVYGQWGHTVSFYGNGVTLPLGSTATGYSARLVPTGRSFAETTVLASWATNAIWPNNPSRVGYTFMGWYTWDDSHGVGVYVDRVDANTPITGDVALRARWEQVLDMIVEFDPNDGITPHTSQPTLADGSVGSANWPANPSRTSHHFMHWTRTQDGSGMATGNADGIRFTETSTITGSQSPFRVYAQWGHQVTFNGNGMTLNVPASPNPNAANQYGPRIVSAGRSLIESNALVWTDAKVWPNNPVHPTGNEAFVGWYTRDAGGNYQLRFDANTPITGDVELFARWEVRRVNFHPNGGDTLPGHHYRITQTNGQVGETNMPATPNNPGFTFMGWNRAQDGTGAGFTGTTTVALADSPLTVYAQWGHPVTFFCWHVNLAAGTGVNGYSQRLIMSGKNFDETNALPAFTAIWPNDPVRTGYNFTGWIDGFGNSVDRNTPITNNTYLIATWSERLIFEVTFDPTQFGAIGAGHSDIRQSWYGWNVNTSGSTVIDYRLNTRNHTFPCGTATVNRLWPRSAPLATGVTSDGRAMSVESWWTEPGGQFGTGTWWSSRGGPNTATSTTGIGRGAVASTYVFADITVFPNFVFEVTFHPNGGNTTQFRDIATEGPNFDGGTVNANGFNGRVWGTNEPNFMGLPGSPGRAGYVFVGWWSHPIPANVPVGQEEPWQVLFTGDEWIDQNTTVYARWIRIPPQPIDPPEDPVRVRFHLNGGTWWSGDDLLSPRDIWLRPGRSVNTSGNAPHPLTAVMPQFPVRDGYIFMGWYTTLAGPPNPPTIPAGLPRFHSGTVVHEDMDVYAHWVRYYTITFDANGGFYNPNQYNPVNGTPSQIFRRVAVGHTMTQMATIWDATLSWENRSGSARPPCMAGVFYSFSTANTGVFPHRAAGHSLIFQSHLSFSLTNTPWNTSPTPATDPLNQRFWLGTPITGDITVYAQWQATVTFVSNAAAVGGAPNATTTRIVALGQATRTHHVHPHTPATQLAFPTALDWASINTPNAVVRGWNTQPDGLGLWVTVDCTIVAPIRLYAQWSIGVVFLPNGAPPGTILPEHEERYIVPMPGFLSSSVSPCGQETGMPPDPVWAGALNIEFLGWSTDPRGFGGTVGGVPWTATQVTATAPVIGRPTILHAIWRAPIHLNGAGGTFTVQNYTNETGLVVEHIINNPLGPLFPTAGTEQRSNWNFIEWNHDRWGLRDATGQAYNAYTVVLDAISLYAQWAANVTFELHGGNIAGETANVIRPNVPEGASINPYPATPAFPNGIPGGHYLGMPANPQRAGFEFLGWYTREWDAANNEFVYTPFTGTTRILNGHTTVHARWRTLTTSLSFVKTDDGIYENPYVINPLSGAVFRLYRQVSAIPEVWEFIAQQTSAPGTGLVNFGPDAITYVGTYRIVESQGPPGHNTPDGDWVLTWNEGPSLDPFIDPDDESTWVMVFTPRRNTAIADSEYNAMFRWLNGAWHVGNDPTMVPLAFYKVDERINNNPREIVPVPGAQFHLDRLDGATWVPVTSAAVTSDANGRVDFGSTHLWVLGTYRLREVYVPEGFEAPPTPPGEFRWEITGTLNSVTGAFEDFQFTSLPYPAGSSYYSPEFVRYNDTNGYRWFVYNARSTVTFEFFKTDDRLYETPRVITLLPGATFRLYRYEEDPGGGTGTWERVPNPNGPGYYEVTSNSPGGRVVFDLSRDGEYKIREIAVPSGFRLPDPDAYWRILFNSARDAVASVTTSDEYENPPFVFYSDAWYVGNVPIRMFEFLKTNEQLYSQPNVDPRTDFLLAGAQFRLFRYHQPGTPSVGLDVSGLVTYDANAVGNPYHPWVEVVLDRDESSTDPLETIAYGMNPRYTYQLVEVVAPSGFQLPWGQWRIRFDPSVAPGNFAIQYVGDHLIPAFAFRPDAGNLWYVGNRPNLNLPLLGGLHVNTAFLIGGLLAIALAFGTAVLVAKQRVKVSPVDRNARGARPPND